MMSASMETNLVSRSPCMGAPLHRRDVLRLAASSAMGLATTQILRAQSTGGPQVALGLDAYSLRAMRWKAPRLIDYAAEQELDAVLFNGLDYFESLDDAYLKRLRETAHSHGMQIYVGVGSISEASVTFSNKYGTPETLLAKGLRVAQAVGSPAVNVRIGKVDDRYTEGGIQARARRGCQDVRKAASTH